jgi:hypothetical protein
MTSNTARRLPRSSEAEDGATTDDDTKQNGRHNGGRETG